MNTITLIGYVGKDAECRTFENGGKVANFTFATTERGYTLQNGTQVPDQTDWHNIVCHKGLAEFAEKWARKGQPFLITGRVRYREYTNQAGEKRYITEVIARTIEFLPSKKQDKGDTPNAEADHGESQAQTMTREQVDDLPF